MATLQLCVSAVVLSLAVITVTAVPQFDKYKLLINNTDSQASVGFYFHPLATSDFPTSQFAEWVTDFENQRQLFILGEPSMVGYTHLLCFADIGYHISSDGSSLTCSSVPVTFSVLNLAYMYPYVRYLTDAIFNNQTFRMFAGVSPDPFTGTTIANIVYLSANMSSYAFNAMLSPTGFSYYAYANVTMGTPASSWYTIPDICNAPVTNCTPPCGANAVCSNNTCSCIGGYSGNAYSGCTVNVNLQQNFGSLNLTYDQFVLNSTGDAMSQTCVGTYGNPITGASTYSAWVQDLTNQNMRWDIGAPNQNGSISYYYLQNGTYKVTYQTNGTYNCTFYNLMTFNLTFSKMFYPTLRYVSLGVYNNAMCHVYIGLGQMAPDMPTSGLVKYVTTNGLQNTLLAVLNSQGYVYYDYPNVTLGQPAKSWFQIPSECPMANAASRSSLAIAWLAVLTYVSFFFL